MYECPSCGDLVASYTTCRACGCCGECCPALSGFLDARIQDGQKHIVKKDVIEPLGERLMDIR